MKIILLLGLREQGYMPETLLAWDEYQIDENSGGFETAMQETKKKYEKDMLEMRTLAVEIADSEVLAVFSNPTLVGKAIRWTP